MPQSKPIHGKKDSSITPDVRARPKKTARFSTPNLRTSSSAGRRDAYGEALRSQTTLTQIDFVKLNRQLSEREFNFIDDAQSSRLPGTTVDHDNGAVPDEAVSRCKSKRAIPARGMKRGLSAISLNDTEKDDTLTQMGFVKSSFGELQDSDIEHGELDGFRYPQRGAVTDDASQDGETSNAANYELGRSRKKLAKETSEGNKVSSQGETGLHIQDQPEAPQQSGLFVTPQKNSGRKTPASSTGKSPKIAETPEQIIEEESPTRRRSTRGRRLYVSHAEARETSPTPSVQSDVLGPQLDAAVPVCSSSVNPTQSSLGGGDINVNHTPDTSPTAAIVDFEEMPIKREQYTPHSIANRDAQDKLRSLSRHSRCISGSQEKDSKDLPRSSINGTEDRQRQLRSHTRGDSARTIKKEQFTQSQSVRIPPSISDHVSNDKTIIESQKESQCYSPASHDYLQNTHGVADSSLNPSILYARKPYGTPSEPLSSDLREIDSAKMRQLFPRSSQHLPLHQLVQLSETDQEEVPTQSQSCFGSSRSRIIQGSNGAPFLGKDQEYASTEFVPDSSDAICNQQSGGVEQLSQNRPGESFPSSPPAILVRSSQPNHILEGVESESAGRSRVYDGGETPRQRENEDADVTAQRDSSPIKPVRLNQLLSSSLMTWPKPLFEIDGLVWNGETHVRLSQLPEDEAAQLLEKGRHRN